MTAYKSLPEKDKELLPVVRAIAREAGRVIMRVYNEAASNDNAMQTEIKADNSPVTVADKLASGLIGRSLKRLTPDIPVVCEENDITIDPATTPAYWAVDPLDGTKEFIGRTGGFAVKIALLRNNVPVLAAVFSPVQDTLYYTATGEKSYKRVGDQAPVELNGRRAPRRGELTTLFNRTHADPAIYAAQRAALAARGLKIPENPHIIPGLPRNLQVAEGLADMVVVSGNDPTLQRSSGFVWDNATDWLLVRNAGGAMVRLTDGRDLRFDMPVREKMPGYATFGDRRAAARAFPEL